VSGAKVSAAEAARLAGVSARTMSRHLAAGKVPGAERVGGGWRVPVDGLVAAGYPMRTSADPAPDAAAEAAAWRERARVAEAEAAGLRDTLAAVERALGHAEARLAALPPGAPEMTVDTVGTGAPSSVVAPPARGRGGRLRGWWRRS
jgi:hypothetical protein